MLYCLGYKLFRNILYRSHFQLKESTSLYFSKLSEQLINIEFIKIHGLISRFAKRLETRFKDVLSKSLHLQVVEYSYTAYDKFLTTLVQVIMMFFCGIQIINDELTIGGFTIILNYFNIVMSSVRYYFTLGNSIQGNLASYKRLSDLFLIKEEVQGDIDLQSVNKIEIKGLSFSYNVKSNHILDNFSAIFEKGVVYTILGSNGSGKSSLIKLILGLFINEYRGEILFDGLSIRTLNMYEMLNKKIGVSEQEPIMLTDTIRYNLFLDDEERVNEDKVNELIKILNLDSFYSTLYDGLDSMVYQNSSNISGGEKQKISLMRALLKNSDVLILDEPTSALDSYGKSSLANYLNMIKKNKIIIIVTHDKPFLDALDSQVRIIGLK